MIGTCSLKVLPPAEDFKELMKTIEITIRHFCFINPTVLHEGQETLESHDCPYSQGIQHQVILGDNFNTVVG